MWKNVKALALGLCLSLAFFCGPAPAQTTKTPINSTAWTDLGVGPLFLSSIGDAWYAVSAITPSLVQEGFPIPLGGVPVNTGEHVWARAATNFTSNTYTYGLTAGTLTFSWPGTCGNGVIAAAATPACTVPYINSYIIGGSVSGGSSPFIPGATAIAPFTANGASQTFSIPTGSKTLILSSSNATANILHCTLGAGPAVLSDKTILPGSDFPFDVTSATQFSCITSSGNQLVTGVAGSGSANSTAGSGIVVFATPQHVIIDSATLGTLTTIFSVPQHMIIDSATLGTVSTQPVTGTYGSCSVAITTANVAQNLPNIGTTNHSFSIANKDGTSGAGEGVGVNFIGTASLVATDLNTIMLTPPSDTKGTGQGSYTSTLGTNHAISVIAATAGHIVYCVFN